MAYDYKGFVTDLIMGFCGDTLDATRWDTLRDKIAAALEAERDQARAERDDARKAAEARVEVLKAAAGEVIEALRCPDCNGSGTLGEYDGKPVACEKCYGHENSAGLGYVLDGDNLTEKLDTLIALIYNPEAR